MPAPTTSAQRQFLIKVNGVDGYFATRRGGEVTSDASREFDGGSLVPEVLTSPATPGDLTVGRAYKAERDAAVLAELRKKVGRWRTSVNVQPTDQDLVAKGRPTVYHGILIGVSDPEADANSGDPARLELTFAVETVS